MKSINKKLVAWISLVWLGCVVSLAAFQYFLAWPRQERLEDIKAQIRQYEYEQQVISDAHTAMNRAKIIGELQQREDLLAGYLADYSNSTDLPFAIRELIDPNEIYAFTNTYRRGALGKELADCRHITEQRIDLELATGFNGFVRLVNTLERNQPVIFVDGFTVERDRQEAAVEITMQLAVFVKNRRTGDLTAKAY